jgi:histone H2A
MQEAYDADIRMGHKKTITHNGILTGVRIILEGELTKFALKSAAGAVQKMCASKKNKSDCRRSRSLQSDLKISVAKVEKAMRLDERGVRLSEDGVVAMAGVAEYIATEIWELAGNAAKKHKRHTVATREIELAVRKDEDLSKLFGGTIPGGGVVPHVQALLLGKKHKKHKEHESHCE